MGHRAAAGGSGHGLPHGVIAMLSGVLRSDRLSTWVSRSLASHAAACCAPSSLLCPSIRIGDPGTAVESHDVLRAGPPGAGHLETDDVAQMPLDPPQRHERPPPADIPLPLRVDREVVRQLDDLHERQTADAQQQRNPAEVGPCRRTAAQEPGQREEHHDAKAVQHLVAMMVLHKICSSILHKKSLFSPAPPLTRRTSERSSDSRSILADAHR